LVDDHLQLPGLPVLQVVDEDRLVLDRIRVEVLDDPLHDQEDIGRSCHHDGVRALVRGRVHLGLPAGARLRYWTAAGASPSGAAASWASSSSSEEAAEGVLRTIRGGRLVLLEDLVDELRGVGG